MRIRTFILSFVLLTIAGVETPAICQQRQTPILRKSEVMADSILSEMVIVKGDTVPMVIAEKNYGRFNRGLYNFLYIPAKTWSFGLTASYGELGTEDVRLLSVLENVDFKGKLYSIKPTFSYFFKSNQAIGVRFSYTNGTADIQNLSVDIDDDMSFELHDVGYHSHNYKMGLFYRNYVGLGRASRFAVFNEVSFDVGTGTTRFNRYYDDVLYETKTISTTANLNFSPGVCVFIQDYVAFNISFGVFGLHVSKDSQTTNGESDGSRVSSGANFRFNIFNINFGLMVVI